MTYAEMFLKMLLHERREKQPGAHFYDGMIEEFVFWYFQWLRLIQLPHWWDSTEARTEYFRRVSQICRSLVDDDVEIKAEMDRDFRQAHWTNGSGNMLSDNLEGPVTQLIGHLFKTLENLPKQMQQACLRMIADDVARPRRAPEPRSLVKSLGTLRVVLDEPDDWIPPDWPS